MSQNYRPIKCCTLQGQRYGLGRGACVTVEAGLKSWSLQASMDITGPLDFPCPFGQAIGISSRLLFSVSSNMFQFWSRDSILALFGLLVYMMKTPYTARGISCFSEDILAVNKTTSKTGLASTNLNLNDRCS